MPDKECGNYECKHNDMGYCMDVYVRTDARFCDERCSVEGPEEPEE